MLRQNLPTNQNGVSAIERVDQDDLEVTQELMRLEEMILESPSIPFSNRTLIDEDHVLDQLDQIRKVLPQSIQAAEDILRRKSEMLRQADAQVNNMLSQAQQRAAQILDESGIIQQAQREAQQIRQQVNQECAAAQAQVLAEMERIQQQTYQLIEEKKRQTLEECEQLYQDANLYADRVLEEMELRLTQMINQVRNGRQDLQPRLVKVKDKRRSTAP